MVMTMPFMGGHRPSKPAVKPALTFEARRLNAPKMYLWPETSLAEALADYQCGKEEPVTARHVSSAAAEETDDDLLDAYDLPLGAFERVYSLEQGSRPTSQCSRNVPSRLTLSRQSTPGFELGYSKLSSASRALTSPSPTLPASTPRPGSRELQRRRKLHPRLRWPRLQHPDARCRSTTPIDEDDVSVASSASLRRSSLTKSPRLAAVPVRPVSTATAASIAPSSAGAWSSRTRGSQSARAAILGRAPPQPVIEPGTTATLHALCARELLGVADSESFCELSVHSEDFNVEPLDDNEDDLDIPRPEDLTCLQTVDRKWFLRVAPISCLPAQPKAKAARRQFVASVAHLAQRGETFSAPTAEVGEYLNFERWGIHDDYLKALLQQGRRRVRGVRGVRQANLSHNQLTDRSLALLADSGASETLQSLNFSHNRLHEHNALGAMKSLGQFHAMKDLTLNGNAIGDSAVVELCQRLEVSALGLVGLGLAQCSIGQLASAGAALGNFICTARHLNNLDLSWNMLHGAGAVSFLKGLYENNVETGGVLRRLSLAWNRLGSSLCVKEASQCARLLGDVFREGSQLFHLDLSYNGINAHDCAILAESLLKNHTLYGLHLMGNDAIVDDRGFVTPLSRELLPAKPSVPKVPVARNGERRMTRLLSIGRNTSSNKVPSSPDFELPMTRMASSSRHSSANKAKELRPALTCREDRVLCEQQQREINSYVRDMPECLRIDNRAEFTSRKKQTVVDISASDREAMSHLSVVPLQNPSTSCLLPQGGDRTFTQGDLGEERVWLEERSRVHTIYDVAESDAEAVQRNVKCCWICENWVEHRISFPFEKQLGEQVPPLIYAFHSIDDFKYPTQLKQEEGASRVIRRRQRRRIHGEAPLTDAVSDRVLRFSGLRMLPPSCKPISVIFSVNGQIRLSPELEKETLIEPRQIQVCEELGNSRAETVTSVNLIFVSKECSGPTSLAPLCVFEDPANRGILRVLPRATYTKKAEEKIEWTVQRSIFKGYCSDDESRAGSCFDVDWSHGRLPQLIKSEEAQNRLINLLRPRYLPLTMAFWYEVATGIAEARSNTLEPAGVPISNFRQMLEKLGSDRGKIVDGASCRVSDVDCVFIASNVVEKTRREYFKVLPARNLARFQFLESLVRIAARRFVGDFAQAMEVFLDLTEIGENFLAMRRELLTALFCRECSEVIENYERMLVRIFDHFSQSDPCPSEYKKSKRLSYRGWIRMLTDVRILDETFSVKDGMLCFALGEEIIVDEVSSWRQMELTWNEFIVSLAAVCTMREDYDQSMLPDILDGLLTEKLQPAANSLLTLSTKKSAEDSPALTFLRTLFVEMDTASTGSLDVLAMCTYFNRATVREQMLQNHVLPGVVYMVLNRLKDEFARVSEDELCGAMQQLQSELRGMERALWYLDKAMTDVDADGSGDLDATEFKQMLEVPSTARKLASLGLALDSLDELLLISGLDADAKITMVEVIQACVLLKNPQVMAERGMECLREAFDAVGKEKLNKAEVLEAFAAETLTKKLAKLKLPPPDWDVLFDELDIDGSGDLDWEEISDGIPTFWETAIGANEQ